MPPVPTTYCTKLLVNNNELTGVKTNLNQAKNFIQIVPDVLLDNRYQYAKLLKYKLQKRMKK